MNQNIMERLREPFAFNDVEWKIQVTTQDKARGMAVAYLNSRAIQKRLDEVVGVFRWKNAYEPWQGNAQVCGLSLYDDERGEWVTKFDGSENTDIEPIKGGLSHAFKRAACVWGIGRYLYELGGVWVEVESKGKSSIIKDNQYQKLETEYTKAVAKISAGSADPAGNAATTAGSSRSSNPAAPAKQSAPKGAATGDTAPQDPPAQQSAPADEYKVRSIKPSGKSSQLLELVDGDGEIVSAYIKTGDQAVIAGSRLQMVKMERKTGSYGDYNLINSYQMAA